MLLATERFEPRRRARLVVHFPIRAGAEALAQEIDESPHLGGEMTAVREHGVDVGVDRGRADLILGKHDFERTALHVRPDQPDRQNGKTQSAQGRRVQGIGIVREQRARDLDLVRAFALAQTPY